ncbi:MAG: PAS domain-containing protein [Oscillospiraceae bacterium]|nr:PAS domain-containing protein [Oscillospiraceae bacterium]
MTNKIFRFTVLVAAVVLLCSLGVILGALYDYFDGVQVSRLKDELSLAAAGTEESGLAFLQRITSDRFRVTWVASDGTVLYDTHADAEQMDNHLEREEIQEALRVGTGSASRRSDTLLERTVYEAKRLSDGSVLRISVSQKTMMILVIGMLQPVCLVALIAILLSAVLAHKVSQKVMEPLNGLDLEHPLENDTYEELSPLLNRIHQQHNEIASQMRKLQRKTDEFEQVTRHMREGLVLLDKNSVILSINPAAQELFGADRGCVGKNFYELDRRQDMTSAVEAAFRDGRRESKAVRNGREYKFLFNRIESGEKPIGLVILAFDITDVQNAERNRREFSANVSHELKTPLQSIIGSAELLENGLVKPEDQARFVGHIRKEASRLMLLIEDVIRISHLDEGVEIPREEIDLLAAAREIAHSLQLPAEKKGVTIHVTGQPCKILGVRGLIYEIIQNLCSNAVKYNVENGRVDVRVVQSGGHTVLTVSDTGIGIPPEHQSRVFERFYRVDKSHSKETGGTGLGLSIVKHAALYHNAQINLQSTPNIGTTITVTF